MKYFLSGLFFLLCSGAMYGQAIQPAGSASFCAGESVVLSINPSVGGPYQWLVGGIIINGATNAAYTAAAPGNYSVIITVNGKPDTLKTVAVTVKPFPLVPAFTFNSNLQCASLPVNFNVTAPVAGVSYTWNFGDATTAAGAGITHPYAASLGIGTQAFTASVQATSAGCSTKSASQTVTVNQLPDPLLEDTKIFSQFNNCGNNTGSPVYTETVNNITTNPNTIAGYTLNWGDGGGNINVANSSFPLTHSYNDYGVFTLSYTATNGGNGCSNTKTYTVINQLNPAVGIEGPPGGSTQRCESAGFWFKVKNYINNTPGTVYTWNFGDGSPTVTWTTPLLVDSIYHLFTKGSCELPGKQFIVSVSAQNKCDVTSAYIDNIKIFKKPKADFTIDPNPACTNKTISFTNTGISAFNGPDCNTNTKYLWNFGDPGSDAQNTAVTKDATHVYTVGGIYTVTLISNGVCGADSIKKTVCIVAPPSPGFTLDQSAGCSPVAVITTNNTNSFNACAAPTYKWTVTYEAGFCGTTASWNFNSGTNDSSANPSFTFLNPGTYKITLSVKSPCGTDSVNKTVIVKQKPQVAINPVTAICADGSISPQAMVTGCSPVATLQYNWTFTDGIPAASTNILPGNISYSLLGSHPIQLSVTNECGITAATTVVNITAPPVANAGFDKTICSRGSASIGTTAVAGITYQWIPATGLSSTNTAITKVSMNYNGVNADTTYTYIISASAGADCSSKDTVKVTVKKRPVVVLKPTSVTICAGANAQLTASGAATYTWLPATGLSNTNSDTVLAAPATTAIYQVIGTGASGCADTGSVTVNIQAFPNTSAGNDSIVCNNTTAVQFSGLPTGGVWTGSNITSNGIFNPAGAGNGLFTLYYTAKLNQCSKTDSLTVTVINPPVANAGSDTAVCQNNTPVLLAGTPAGGSWSGIVLISANGVFTPSATGVYAAIYTYGSGSCIAKDTVVITVGPGITNNIISPNQSVCVNVRPLQITGQTATGGNSTPAYQWQFSTDSVSWTDLPGEISLNYTPPVLLVSTFYRRIAFTSLCAGSQGSFSVPVKVTVRQDATALFTANPVTGCTPFNLATTITVTPYSDRNGLYQWSADGVNIGSNATGIFPGYMMLSSNDTVMIKLITTSQYGCRPDTLQQQFITVITAQSKFTKDTGYGCGPLPVNFTNTSSIINNISFAWNFGNGITSTLRQPGKIIFNASPDNRDTTYQVALKAFNGCDTTVWRDSVKIRANPKAKFGVDTTAGCSPFTVVINNISLGAPNTYYWNFGNGHLDTTYKTGSLNYTYNAGNRADTFLIQLIAANECKRDTQVINVRVAPNNIQPRININGSDLYGCASHTVAFNNGTTGATSFTWNFGDGTPVVITNNSLSSVVHTFNNAGIFTIRISITNGCSDTTVYRLVTVYTKPAAAFTTIANLYCSGDTVKVNNTSSNATNYQWFWADGTGSNGLNPTHIYTVAGNYTIYLRAEKTNNFGLVCYDTIVKSIRVSGKPIVIVQSNIKPVNCAPFTLSVAAPGIISENANWYFYDSTVSPSIINLTGTAAQYMFNKPGTFYVKLLAKNGAGCTDSTIISFTVNGKPVASFTPSGLSICKRDTIVAYINTTTYNGNDPVKYNWQVDNLSLSTNGNFTHQYTVSALAALPRIFNTSLIVSNTVGCSDTAKNVLQMNPSSKAQFSISNPNNCVPFIATINNNSLYTTLYKWIVNGVLVSTDADPTIVIDKASNLYTVTLIADNIYGCKPDSFTVTFTSRVKPAIAFTVSDTLGCTGVLNVGTSNTTTNANSYIWDWGDNTTASSFTSPTHLYTTQGQYLITLIASNGVCKDTASQLVKISTKPLVDFSVNANVTCGTAKVKFTNLTVNGDNYLWSFGDGTASTEIDPAKSFTPNINPYTIKLVAFSTFGCKDSTIKANLVLAKVAPASDFFISPTPVITVPNYTFSFNNLTLNSNNYQYQWSLGDGTFADTRDVINHKYTDTGNYPIRLIVLDKISNCPDTTIKIARIDGFPGWMFIPNAVCPNCLQENLRTFLPKAVGLKEYHLQIFTTWGELVFETNSLDRKGAPNQPWDAKYKGSLVQQDVYVWKIQAKFTNGSEWLGMIYPGETKYKKAGSITVVK